MYPTESRTDIVNHISDENQKNQDAIRAEFMTGDSFRKLINTEAFKELNYEELEEMQRTEKVKGSTTFIKLSNAFSNMDLKRVFDLIEDLSIEEMHQMYKRGENGLYTEKSLKLSRHNANNMKISKKYRFTKPDWDGLQKGIGSENANRLEDFANYLLSKLPMRQCAIFVSYIFYCSYSKSAAVQHNYNILKELAESIE